MALHEGVMATLALITTKDLLGSVVCLLPKEKWQTPVAISKLKDDNETRVCVFTNL